MTEAGRPDPAASQAPTSWRDVYQLVQDSEKRLTDRITDGFARAATTSSDHEVRIRVLEATDQKQSGGVAALGAGRALLLIVISIGSLIMSLFGIVKP